MKLITKLVLGLTIIFVSGCKTETRYVEVDELKRAVDIPVDINKVFLSRETISYISFRMNEGKTLKALISSKFYVTRPNGEECLVTSRVKETDENYIFFYLGAALNKCMEGGNESIPDGGLKAFVRLEMDTEINWDVPMTDLVYQNSSHKLLSDEFSDFRVSNDPHSFKIDFDDNDVVSIQFALHAWNDDYDLSGFEFSSVILGGFVPNTSYLFYMSNSYSDLMQTRQAATLSNEEEDLLGNLPGGLGDDETGDKTTSLLLTSDKDGVITASNLFVRHNYRAYFYVEDATTGKAQTLFSIKDCNANLVAGWWMRVNCPLVQE